jgi:general secretion pathway protein G
VVLAIVAMLLTIAVPRYFASLDNARDTALRKSLGHARRHRPVQGRRGQLPDNLGSWSAPATCAACRPTRSPARPTSGSRTGTRLGRLRDVHSGAPGNGQDGTPYASW